MSKFWFKFLGVPNHVIDKKPQYYADRALVVKKLKMVPWSSLWIYFNVSEAIVRGYVTGSAWIEYGKNGTIHGMKVRPGMKNCAKLDAPMFTPSTKASLGEHGKELSENINNRS